MAPKAQRWGIVLFACAIPVIALIYYLHRMFPLSGNGTLYARTIPLIGLIASLTSFTVGHFSYPRVHNLKVYLIGYLTGIIGLGFFILYWPPFNLPFQDPSQWYSGALLSLAIVNVFIVTVVPSFVKYRIARGLTLSIVVFEAIVIVIFRFSPASTYWLSTLQFESYHDLTYWIGSACALLIFIVTIWRMRDDFYLGGLFTGYIMILAACWGVGLYKDNDNLKMFFLSISPIYLCVGIMVHWFSRLDHRISYDPLLHIYNRDYCSKIITEQANMNVTPPFAVAMVDIDHFKNVNDTYGHQAGDSVLYSVAQAVCRGVVPNGIACRYGGEELAVFFPQKTTKEVTSIMETVRTDIEKIKTQSGKKQIVVTISIGISHRDNLSQTVIDVIHAADKALYKAKKGGRNQVQCAKISVTKDKK